MEPVVAPRTFSGRYEVTHLIARGGMAQVYRALDTRLGRHVALKVLFPELSVDRTFVERFRREAQAAANLSHPNIVAVYDWGEDEGTYFIVMELITGMSLATALRAEKTMPATKAATIASEVASALAYAHRHGVVHRDIKPGNVLLTDEGAVKVTDFGIAQAVSTEEGLTMAGSVMGTAAYFSPEQAEGAIVDGRSDLYSLGVVLFEMLAGRPPFVGDSPVAVASMHVRNAPPVLRDLSPSVPDSLERVTMRALAKSPDDRYQTAEEMRADLVRFIEGRPVLAAAAVGAVGATSVMGGASTTSVLPPKDATMAVPAVEGLDATGTVAVADPIAEEEGPGGPSSKRTTWIAIGLVVALIAVGLLAWRGLAGAGGITVPNVVGSTATSATTTLRGLDLTVKQVETSNGHASGYVLKVDPPEGTSVQPKSVVTLTVSSGPAANVLVPSVVGLSLSSALNQLADQKLNNTLKYVPSWPSPAIPGTVLQQSPGANTMVQSNTKVTLTLLAPGGTFPLPNLIDQTQVQAAQTLGQYGLVAGSQTSQCSSSAAQGRVAATSPTQGSPVQGNTVVNLTISTGVCPVQVPDVLGLTQAQATSSLSSSQLSAVPVTSCQAGQTLMSTVQTQSPLAGASVKPGSPVTINFCSTSGPTGTS